MITDHELMIKSFMPKIRGAAANVMLKEYGMRQKEVAALLDTTQAAISKYLKTGKGEGQINPAMLHVFVDSVVNDRVDEAKSMLCTMCQAERHFGCSLAAKSGVIE